MTLWTESETSLLRSIYPEAHTEDIAALMGRTASQVFNAAFSRGLKKSDAYLASESSARMRRGRETPAMVANHIKPGATPWNKGLRGVNGKSCTTFKPGSIPPNRQPVGALRINSDGQLDIKLYDGLRAWKQLSHYAWFLEHGEWPAKGMCIRFKNGDVHDPRIENLRLITRHENMHLNSAYTLYPPEVARLIQLRGALNRQINKHTKESK